MTFLNGKLSTTFFILSYSVQLAIILFSRTWPIYLCVYGFPVMWMNFPKYWTECCSPSSFFSRNPLITDDHAVNKVPQNMSFDESNHILFMCFMKSMYYLTFLSNKQKIDIFMTNHPTIRENHHASVVWNWYHWVAIAYLYQPSP